MTQKALWAVSLSDGSTLHEGKGDFAAADGRKSPWLRLLDFLSEKDLTITSLSLYSGDIRWNLPSGGVNPKFRLFGTLERPTGYKFERKAVFDVMRAGNGAKKSESYAVIKAIYPDGSETQLWVRDDTLACWTAHVPNENKISE